MCHRDESNSGITRGEAVHFVTGLAQINDPKAAESHLDHLVCMEGLKGVKNFVQTVKTQATTTNHGQNLVEQQL